MGLYLMTHSGQQAVKIGIGVASGEAIQRVALHRRHGWELCRQWVGFRTVTEVLDAERAVLAAWRAQGIPEYLSPDQMLQGGSTETASLESVDLATTCRLLDGLLGAGHPIEANKETPRAAA